MPGRTKLQQVRIRRSDTLFFVPPGTVTKVEGSDF